MKFKTIAAATLAVATMLGMGACGSSAGAKDDKTITSRSKPSKTRISKAS